MDLRHHRDCTSNTRALLHAIIENQFIIYKRINQMADDTDARLDALEAIVVQVADGITNEIKQLAASKAGMNPAQSARVDAVISRLTGLRDALQADDDAASSVAVDPTALRNALNTASANGVTSTQLLPVTNLGDGITTPITKAQLAAVLVIVQAPPSDGSPAVTSAQIADLLALSV